MNILIKDLKYRRTGNGNRGRQTDQEKDPKKRNGW